MLEAKNNNKERTDQKPLDKQRPLSVTQYVDRRAATTEWMEGSVVSAPMHSS